MINYPDERVCEQCQEEPADIYADYQWLCVACEEDNAEDTPLLTALELAAVYWGEARIVK